MGWHRACPPSTLQISFHFSVKVGAMRFRQKLVVGWWMLTTGVAMTAWLAGLAWTTAWLIERVIS